MYDYLIIGAGIAGTSLAYRIADRAKVLVLEAESQPGYHATGRSAALFCETYGTPAVRALTRAGRSFFEAPPDGFSPDPLLTDRGVLYAVRKGQSAQKDALLAELSGSNTVVQELSASEAQARMPCLRLEGLDSAVAEPDARDIDVHALLHGFLRAARSAGARFQFDQRVVDARRDQGLWQVVTASGQHYRARMVVNAAGAWAQQVADRFGAIQVGLQSKRRSAFTFAALCEGMDTPYDHSTVQQWPAVVGIDESYYFKPDAGVLMGSPANADPVAPHDVVAEEFDVALGIDRILSVSTFDIRRPLSVWAGLRTFSADGDFVVGRDPSAPDFFWLAGQGGYGIQTAPGASLLAASLLLDEPLAPVLAENGLVPSQLCPSRFGHLNHNAVWRHGVTQQ